MTNLNEYVMKLAREINRHPASLLMWLDDAGGFKINDEYFVLKVDGFAESRARYPWCSYRDFSFKAVTAAVSDVFSKGCRPYVYAVSIGVRSDNVDVVEEMIKGINDAVNVYGGFIENIDTNVGNDIWIDVFILATCRYLPLQRRTRSGDMLIIPRPIGLSYIAYIEYTRNSVPIDEDVKKFSCRPSIDPKIVDCIERARIGLTGSIDISDTLYETIEILSKLNNVGIYIDFDPHELLHPIALNYAYSENLEKIDIIMRSNEEYTPILVINRMYMDEVLELMRSIGFKPYVIGIAINTKTLSIRGLPLKKTSWDYVSGKIV